tara:strand:- start:639 stop:764 length:126 start_codon:yes stop_codon:yes gene_type:complete
MAEDLQVILLSVLIGMGIVFVAAGIVAWLTVRRVKNGKRRI